MTLDVAIIPSQPYHADESSLTLSGNTFSIKDGGVSIPKLASGIGIVTQLVRNTTGSVVFTPTSATHKILIMSKVYMENSGPEPITFTVTLLDGAVVLDTNKCYISIASMVAGDEVGFNPSWLWSGTLSAGAHTINLSLGGPDVSAYTELIIIEIRP